MDEGASAEPTSEPADLTGLISADGIDTVLIGSSVAALGAEWGFTPNGSCRASFFDAQGAHLFVLSDISGPEGTVQEVHISAWGEGVTASPFATAEGIALGSSLAEVIVAYPDGELVESLVSVSSSNAYVINRDTAPVTFQILDETQTVDAIAVGTDHVDSEYCG